MEIIKALSISGILVMLLIGFAPLLDQQVANSVNSSAAYNSTQLIFQSTVELAPFALIALAAAAVIGGLTQL